MMISPLRRNKLFLLGSLIAALGLFAETSHAARGKLTPPAKKSSAAATKKGKSAKGAAVEKKQRGAKSRAGRRTPVLLGTPPTLPREQPLSPDVLERFANGDITHAARGLLMEPASEKTLYLLRETQRIGEAKEQHGKPVKTAAHRFYLNLGVANHNLYLFVKGRQMAHSGYVKEALAAYKKARVTAPKEERAEVDLLVAALLAASGKEKPAQKMFRKIPIARFQDTFQGAAYLVTYYAAQRDIPHTTEALRKVYALNPRGTKSWLRVSDDLTELKDEPHVKELLDEWQIFAAPTPAKKLSSKTTPRRSR